MNGDGSAVSTGTTKTRLLSISNRIKAGTTAVKKFWVGHGAAVVATFAALVGTLVGSHMQSQSAKDAVMIQIQAQQQKEEIDRLGAASSKFLAAIERIYEMADLPRQAPPWEDAIRSVEAADVDLFIYSTPELYGLGNQLKDVVLPDSGSTATGQVDVDKPAYDRAREDFVNAIRRAVR